MLTNPSPRTNPLAATIANSGVFPVPLALVVRYAIYPPINLAMEKLGELRNPTAKAIPDGMYLTHLSRAGEGGKRVWNDLTNASAPKKRPKASMKGMTIRGR
jgi:hypothetical protein